MSERESDRERVSEREREKRERGRESEDKWVRLCKCGRPNGRPQTVFQL